MRTIVLTQIEPGLVSVKAIQRGSVLVDLAILKQSALRDRVMGSVGDRMPSRCASISGEHERSSKDFVQELHLLACDPFSLLSGCVCEQVTACASSKLCLHS